MQKNKTKEKPKADAPLQEGVDFYIEGGFYVFTAAYLTQRGYCCGNGCRHCPYQGLKESQKVKKPLKD